MILQLYWSKNTRLSEDNQDIRISLRNCDPVCEKGSYCLSKLSSWTNNFWWVHHITPNHYAILGVYISGQNLQGDTKFTSNVMSCQVHAIEKALRYLFAEQITIYIISTFSCCHPYQYLYLWPDFGKTIQSAHQSKSN